MDSKLMLSQHEMEMVHNAEWILTKNLIVKKAQRLLEQVQQNISDYVKQTAEYFPREVLAISPKISKGENYRGLPWLILDYPRYFEKENIFAIRTMFWWGNFFSTTLHLAGNYKVNYHRSLGGAYKELAENNFRICVNDDQWQHHYGEDNYLPVVNFSSQEFNAQIERKSFVKLSRELPFSQWEKAVPLLSERFSQLSEWLR